MIELIKIILGLVCFSWVFTNFTPIKPFLKKLNDLPGKIYSYVYILLTCTKCFAFWISICYTKDLFLASIICVFATYLNNFLTDKTNLKR